jgi:hypothetical protein
LIGQPRISMRSIRVTLAAAYLVNITHGGGPVRGQVGHGNKGVGRQDCYRHYLVGQLLWSQAIMRIRTRFVTNLFRRDAVINIPGLGEPRPLFSNNDMSNLSRQYVHEARNAVQQIPSDELLNTPTEDIVATLVDKHSFTLPTLRRDEAYIDGPHEIDLRRNDFGEQIVLRGTLIALVVPFDGEVGMFYMNPNRWGGTLRANLHYNNLILTVRGVNLQTDAVGKQLTAQLDEIEAFLRWQKDIANQHRETLPQQLRPLIEARKQKVLADRHMVANLPFKVRARPDAKQTYVVPVTRKRIVVQRPATTTPFKPEPILDESDYQPILKVIGDMSISVERSPSTFAKIGEEQLRDMFLVPFNGYFEGAAVGETFNAEGKTDILIRVDGRNIFIAECKIWRGPKYLTEALDQLFSYLTWRDTKSAIIVFNRNKDFSAVLSSIRGTVNAHPNRKHGPEIEGETRFRYVFGHPHDNNCEIIVTVLAFDVP